MTIQQDTITEGATTYLYTYSDAGMLIRQNETGMLFMDAMDIVPCAFTYAETDQPIEDTSAPDPYAEAGRILLGDE